MSDRRKPTVSVITDEISPVLDDAIAFAVQNGLTSVDLRVIDGMNVMALSPADMRAAARRLSDHGLTVGCLATPLLKWPGPGQPMTTAGDQFGFDPRAQSVEAAYETALRAAEIFSAPRLRIFSYLTYPSFRRDDLRPALDHLLRMAESADLILALENEHVCNVATVTDLADTLSAYDHPHLRGVLDIANAYAIAAPPTADDVTRAAPYIDIVHLKDYDPVQRRFVTLGTGIIPFAKLLKPLYEQAAPPPPLVVETHVPEDRVGATRTSLRAARALAAQLAIPLSTST